MNYINPNQQMQTAQGPNIVSPYIQPYNFGFMGGQSNNFQNNQFLKCRPVSSRDQAKASQIDLDGSLWVFTDVGNGKIYTKQINNNGTATFHTYTICNDEPEENPTFNSAEYVTKQQFNEVIQNLITAIKQPKKDTNNNSEIMTF